jgi:hypothetical protein
MMTPWKERTSCPVIAALQEGAQIVHHGRPYRLVAQKPDWSSALEMGEEVQQLVLGRRTRRVLRQALLPASLVAAAHS